jgi:peptidyl-prolyl cis-trans isomerase A (cyclophilin A)/peptidyl-prolyl cis-trans isomerase B (cyclophilin B)
MRILTLAATGLLLSLGAALAQDAAAPAPPPAQANPAMTGPQILMETSLGNLTLQLDEVRAPQSVAHFLKLVRANFYNGTAVYRVQKDFVVQMGSWGADGKGRGWNPVPVPLEANNGLKNYKFAVALPRGDNPTGAGPDFYINMRDNLGLDQKPGDTANSTGFAVFGEVTEASRPVLQTINDVAVNGGYGPFAAHAPAPPIVIRRISVVGDPPPPPPPSLPPMTGPQLLITTTLGDIVVQLDSVRAPESVAHILRMARMGHYDGNTIYRVEKDFVAQMGSWNAQGKGKGWVPRPVRLEAANGLKNLKFAVALPRGDNPTSAGPDFYINLRDNLELDQKPGDARSGFAVFGAVTEASRPVVQAINDVAVGGGYGPFGASAPATPIVIRRVSVVGDKPAASTAKPAAATAKPAPARRQ